MVWDYNSTRRIIGVFELIKYIIRSDGVIYAIIRNGAENEK